MPKAQAHEEREEETDYIARQAVLDREYQVQWKKWWDSLSPAERENLRAAGVTGPHVEANGVGAPELDLDRIADMAAEEAPPPAEPLDYSDPRVVEIGCTLARVILGELVSASNKALAVECMALVTGIAYDGASQTEIAARHGVTRAAVSKRCVELADKLGLPPARAMKSAGVRGGLSRAQLEAHEARRRLDA